MQDPWGAVILEIPARIEDDLLGLLAPGTLGATSHPVGPERTRLTLYLETPDAAATAGAHAAALLGRLRVEPADYALCVEPVADGRWAERYQASLRPFALGRRFVVQPAGPAEPSDGRLPLVLVPGQAFGTGEHPTTRGCSAALERWVGAGERWLDLGCGTGILAMVAHHCGAREVAAVDADPEAVRVAREVLSVNGLGERIALAVGTLDAAPRPGWDGVVANIAAPYFTESATVLAGRLRDGGRLVASGFLVDEAPGVSAALSVAGLTEIERTAIEDWVTLVFRRSFSPVRTF